MAVATAYRQAREYQRTQIENARPTQLVLMLYDGAVRFLCAARERMAAHDLEGQHKALVKAQNIVAYLMGSLDHGRGGEVAGNLLRVYTYMYERLVEANLRDASEPVDEVITMLRDLRGSWEEIDRQHARSATVGEDVRAA